MTRDNRKIFRLIGTTGVIYLIFRYLLPLVVPFLFAVIAAKILSPAIDWCYEKIHFPKKFTSVFLLIVFLAVLFLFFGTILVACVKQSSLLIRNLPRYENIWYGTLDGMCCHVDDMFGLSDGMSMGFVQTNFSKVQMMLSKNLTPRVAGYAKEAALYLGKIGFSMFIFLISTIMILGDREELQKDASGNYLYQRLHPVLRKLKATGFSYMKAQGIIIFIVACICVLGLFLIGNPYAVLFGIAIAVFDAFPVVGSGIILVPWAIFHVLGGDMKSAAILISVYIAALVIREVLEPKLLGNCLGVRPLYMLVAIFVGVKVFGVGGIVLGPVGLMAIRYLMAE